MIASALKLKHLSAVLSVALLLILLISSNSNAQTSNDNTTKLYQDKTCWSCHGKDAKTPILPVYPKLAGQNADYAFTQMKDIKSGSRSNGQSAAMKGVMGLVSEDEMKAIADWLSKQ